MALNLSKKQVLVGVLVLVIIAVPIIFLSSLGPSWMQNWVDEHKSDPGAPRMQLRVAKIYRWTLRTKEEVDAYSKYVRYFTPQESPGNHNPEEYRHTAYLWCRQSEELHLPDELLARRYHWFLYELGYLEAYPNDQKVQRALERFRRLRGFEFYPYLVPR